MSSFVMLPVAEVERRAAALITEIDSERARRTGRLVASVRASAWERARSRIFGPRSDDAILESLCFSDTVSATNYAWGDRGRAYALRMLACAPVEHVQVSADDWELLTSQGAA
jgi:hypothetical protein